MTSATRVRVADRIRTGDLRGHDPALGQLSFSHNFGPEASARTRDRTWDLRRVKAALSR
jgi:hypothetical protein